MSTATGNPIADDYLRRLHAAARVLPGRARSELEGDIRAHVVEAVARSGGSDAALMNALDDLGDPSDIVDAARPTTPRRLGVREVAAIALLLVGGIVIPFVGWVVGAVLLLSSPAWSSRQKLQGILVVPFGLLLPLLLLVVPVSSSSCVATGTANGDPTGALPVTGACPAPGGANPLAVAAFVLCVFGPIVTAFSLARNPQPEPDRSAAAI